MCGIVGIADLIASGKTFDPKIPYRMLDVFPWRGPNARGTWENSQLVLGHVRLSIIDLSTEANQPMNDFLGNCIVFNGEIYNYRDLRKELVSEYAFRTQSDTEVILAAYAKWGTDCVKQFNGEWAFAIYDKKKNSLFLSRDRYGIKPLYYAEMYNRFHFASEIRSLLAAGIPAKMSIQKIATFLKFRQIEPRYDTIINEIFPLEPGKNLIIDLDTGKIEETYFYTETELFSADVPRNENEASELFGSLFQDAVRLRLQADVSVQVLLSGGLDSSAIAALSMKLSGGRIKTLSHIFPGDDSDESYYSDMVAAHLVTDHHRVTSDSGKFFEVFDQVIEAQDFPTYSEKHVARYLLYQKAAKHAKVVIEGQGGDEIFGGYGKMYKIFREHYQNLFGVDLLMETPQKKAKSDLPHFSELDPDVRKYVGRITKSIDTMATDDPYRKQQFYILRNNLLALLHTGDRLQMFNSIEGRYPFLDHRVVEFGMSMPVRFKMQDYDKYLLRVFLERNKLLPLEVIRRTDKKGFSTDFENFLLKSGEARSHFQESFVEGNRALPRLFDMNTLEQLIAEQYERGINNNRRLLATYSLIKYMVSNKVTITGLN